MLLFSVTTKETTKKVPVPDPLRHGPFALTACLVLALCLSAATTRAADDGGRYLYKISRPNGIVMVVELYGYELDDAQACQEEAYRQLLDDWDYEARVWAKVVRSGQYPVPKPVKPQATRLEDLTGKDDKQRGAAREKHQAEVDDWNVCAITDLHGNTSARAIRSDYMLRAQIIEMTLYANAMVAWTDVRTRAGNDAAGKPPEKPVLKTIAKNLKSVAEAQKRVGQVNAEIAEARQKEGTVAPDANPPTTVKAQRVQWPGLVTIYHGSNWQGDETFVTAIKEANYGASGCAEWQINHCAKRGLHAFVFLWAHEAGTIPARYRHDDAVLCYYLGDRIPPGKWGSWAALEAAAYGGDPHHPAVFSMSPRAWGGIELYFPIVRGRAVEYYHYHWDGRRSPQNHFAYLELYRQHAARHGNVPIIRLLETRAEDMRKTSQTVFTSLAYGVRGFQYGGGLFDGNQRDERGVPTRNHLGEAAARINQAIKAFSPLFKRVQNVDVFQTAPLPPFAKEAPADYWVRPSGANVVLGVFADRFDHYLVLANRDAFNAHEATLHFAEQGLRVSKLNKETGEWDELVLKPGDTAGMSVTISMEEAGGELLRVVGHYFPPELSGPDRFVGQGTVRISCRNPAGTIHYTLDGSPPTRESAVYEQPLEISATSRVRAIFVDRSDRATAPVEATFTKVPPRRADGKTLGPGVAYEYYEGAWPKLPSFDQLKPVASGICDQITLDVRRREENYALRFSGYLEIKTAGSYTFALGSDDGSRLSIDGKVVIDVDGIHGVITKEQAVELQPGMHKIDVVYMQGQHGYDLKLEYEGPEVSRSPLALWCEQ